jgi:acyl-CoA thioesterase-2
MRPFPPEPLERLVRQLDLERIEDRAFVGENAGPGRRLFGGLVAAQAVVAAGRTAEQDTLHSLHAYFLRPGRPGVPIRYAVTALKDGRSFSARHVVAWQAEEIVFTLQASFTGGSEGIEHQDEMPEVAALDEALAREEQRREREGPGRHAHHPVAMYPLPLEEQGPGERRAARKQAWTRPKGELPDDPLVHAATLVYATDRSLLSTGALPHHLTHERRRSASLDHAVWLHQPPRFDDWLLYRMESPIATAGRALMQGALYRRDGVRVASVAQEGLIRIPSR